MPAGDAGGRRGRARRCASPRTRATAGSPTPPPPPPRGTTPGSSRRSSPAREARAAKPQGSSGVASEPACPTARSRTRPAACRAGWQLQQLAGRRRGRARRGRRAGRPPQRPAAPPTDAGGADSSVSVVVKVTPQTNYRLSGRIRTRDLNKGTGLGALLNVHELQAPARVDDQRRHRHDATGRPCRRASTPASARSSRSTACSAGGAGRRGTAWFDDVRLEPIGEGAGALETMVRVVTTHYAQARAGRLGRRDALGAEGRRRGDGDWPCSTGCSRAGPPDGDARRPTPRPTRRCGRCRRRCRRTTAPAWPRSPSGSAAASCSPRRPAAARKELRRVARRRIAARPRPALDAARRLLALARRRGERRGDPQARHARSRRPRWRPGLTSSLADQPAGRGRRGAAQEAGTPCRPRRARPRSTCCSAARRGTRRCSTRWRRARSPAAT